MLMRAAKRLVCAVVVSNLIIGPVATAQQSNPPATNAGSPGTQTTPVSVSKPTGTKKPTAAPDPTAPPAKPATPIKPSLQSEIAKDATSVFGDIGDYVPCEFTWDALLSLRPTPDVITLTAKQEDELRSRIIAEAQNSSNAQAFPQGQVQQDFLVKSIAEASFVGLTPSHAIGKVINILWSASQPEPDATDLALAAQSSKVALCAKAVPMTHLRSSFNSPVATFRRQKIQLISSAARTQSSRRHSDRRCPCTSLPADTGTEAASSSRAFGPGLRTSTQ